MDLYGNEFRLLINKQIALAKAECYANWQEFDYCGEMVYCTRLHLHAPSNMVLYLNVPCIK